MFYLCSPSRQIHLLAGLDNDETQVLPQSPATSVAVSSPKSLDETCRTSIGSPSYEHETPGPKQEPPPMELADKSADLEEPPLTQPDPLTPKACREVVSISDCSGSSSCIGNAAGQTFRAAQLGQEAGGEFGRGHARDEAQEQSEEQGEREEQG